jgi:hypothetical protein
MRAEAIEPAVARRITLPAALMSRAGVTPPGGAAEAHPLGSSLERSQVGDRAYL